MKKTYLAMLFLILFIPVTVFAYSGYLIPSGKNIGLMLKSNNVLVVGSYEIDDYDILKETDLKVGDKITKINGKLVTSVKEMQEVIDSTDTDFISINYLRGEIEKSLNIPLYQDGKILKTGLYVRDNIRGVATLTYLQVDDNGKVYYGSLGHEILEKTSKTRFDASSGTIFSSTVTGVTKSENGSPGEKNAKSNSRDILGTVSKNTIAGVFGEYTGKIGNEKKYKVANFSDIKLGKAQMLTVIKGDEVEAFDINIIKVNDSSNTKNILFEVTDQELLAVSGGIVQGMSGSPIIQDDYILGAVNYVLVDSPKKGYGIFITNMLKEANK